MLFTLKVVTPDQFHAVDLVAAGGLEFVIRRAARGEDGIQEWCSVSTIEQSPATGLPPTGEPVIPGKRTERKGSILAGWLSSTDHKVIGYMYLITSFAFFIIAGIMAIIIRLQLFEPANKIVSDQVYNELFTIHGTIMLLLFATPLFVGFANAVMPLQIGAPDVAFPRMNLLSYYFFLFGGLIVLASFLSPGGAAAFGWYAYSPLTSAVYSRASARTCGSWA